MRRDLKRRPPPLPHHPRHLPHPRPPRPPPPPPAPPPAPPAPPAPPPAPCAKARLEPRAKNTAKAIVLTFMLVSSWFRASVTREGNVRSFTGSSPRRSRHASTHASD